jgi:hypothetical protein
MSIHKGYEISMSELRAQVAEAVEAMRLRKAKTRTNQKYLKMSGNSSRISWSRREDTSLLELPSQDLQLVLREAMKKRQTASGRRLSKTRPDSTGKRSKNKGNVSET